MTYKPDWADRLASSTTDLRSKNSWEYEHPINAWERMPWFIRWPLAVLWGGFLLANVLAVVALMFRS